MLPGSGRVVPLPAGGLRPRALGPAAAFLFIWQFLLSGPLELASGLIAMDAFAQSAHPGFRHYNDAHTVDHRVCGRRKSLSLTVSPGRLLVPAAWGWC